MKKTIFTIILATVAMNINAQLVVDSIGRVGIGTETPKSMLTVGTSPGDTIAAVHCQPNYKEYGIRVKNYFSQPYSTCGIYSRATNLNGESIGIDAYARGGNNMNTPQWAIGVSGRSGYSQTGIGIYGGRYTGSGTPGYFAGVYGSYRDYRSFYDYPGIYAGYFDGQVRVTDGIYATVLTPSTSASPSGQNGTTILSERGENVTDKLSQVQTLQFLRYDLTKEENTAKANPTALDIDNMSPEELDSLATNADEEPERYLSAVQYGLAADQLKQVYPELVYEDQEGNYSINYIEMVPLLVQSIKELSAKVETLEQQLGVQKQTKKVKSETTGIENNVSDIDMVRMDQNKPNPFSESTVIGLNIPEKTQKANIFIYDLSGKQIKSILVSERGETNITVYASSLNAGMYIYTLVTDGKVVVTRRMIVEK